MTWTEPHVGLAQRQMAVQTAHRVLQPEGGGGSGCCRPTLRGPVERGIRRAVCRPFSPETNRVYGKRGARRFRSYTRISQ